VVRFLKTSGILACLVLLPTLAYAQASITGVVKDSSGAVLPGVTVEASSPVLIEKTRTAVSDSEGLYRIIDLRPGTYTVTFTLTGFSAVKREGIELSGTFIATVNADMKVGSIEETIRVIDVTDVTGGFVRDWSGARASEKPDPCAASANGGCIRPPIKIKDVRPHYPAGSAGGNVELVAVIDNNGLVTNLDVTGNGAGGPADIGLADAAAVAVRQWEFLPTHLDGQSIETKMKVHVSFAAK